MTQGLIRETLVFTHVACFSENMKYSACPRSEGKIKFTKKSMILKIKNVLKRCKKQYLRHIVGKTSYLLYLLKMVTHEITHDLDGICYRLS